LQHSRIAQEQHRGIFIREGLIGTIISYHKGYNITGSTKIIQRYLPKELGELLVSYLWLVLPFWRKDLPLTFLRPKDELLHHENKGLRIARATKKKYKKQSKPVNLKQRKEFHSDAVC
jgi:hypothetical protein